MSHYAVSWSGGKDSTLALDRAYRQGLDVTHLVNIFEGTSGLVRFHGVDRRLIQEQAEALGMKLIQRQTHPDDFETVFRQILMELAEQGIEGIIFGNIHLADIRGWFEERTSAYGLHHVEPLWDEHPQSLVNEFVDLGYMSTVVGIDLDRSCTGWLGRRFDRAFIEELQGQGDVDVCGERGEYHTFVSDGPLFRWQVPYVVRGEGEIDGHRHLDLQPIAPAGDSRS